MTTLRRVGSHRPKSDVTISLDGCVVCPMHGELPSGAEYQAGRAVCGCVFVQMPDGLLRAESAHNSQSCSENLTSATVLTPE